MNTYNNSICFALYNNCILNTNIISNITIKNSNISHKKSHSNQKVINLLFFKFECDLNAILFVF